MASLTIKGLTKKYDETIAVKDFNLEVKNKEFLVLVGPSGCGKTTVLNSIAGLISINEGEIWFGEELVDAPQKKIFKIPQKRGVAMVFQDYAIYPHMTVYSNMAFPLEVRKVAPEEIKDRVVKAARLLGIDHLLQRKPKALSGGQKQRIALGRAIVRNPKIFLMDEPLANLDAKLRVQARVELKKLQKELGVTTIFVTHDQIEAMTMGDRIALMNNGRIEQIGTPLELYQKPKNIFVADFIGSPPINIFQGDLVNNDKKIGIDLKFFFYPLTSKLSKSITNKEISKVALGIRPENVLIVQNKKDGLFQANILRIEPVGKEYNIHLEVEGKPFISIESSPGHWQEGDKVWVAFAEDYIYIFDLESGDIIS
jgi:multiple sugar transport system ATP-binding protein